MSVDEGLRRAAGIIMWKLSRGVSTEDAVAFASYREPDLNDRDLQTALQWAQAGLRFQELIRVAPKGMTLAEIRRRAGLPE